MSSTQHPHAVWLVQHRISDDQKIRRRKIHALNAFIDDSTHDDVSQACRFMTIMCSMYPTHAHGCIMEPLDHEQQFSQSMLHAAQQLLEKFTLLASINTYNAAEIHVLADHSTLFISHEFMTSSANFIASDEKVQLHDVLVAAGCLTC